MNVSEYYEYKKDNDKQIADYNAQMEKEKKEQKKEKQEKTKDQLKSGVEKVSTVVSAIPHFTKAAGLAAILGAIGSVANNLKNGK